MQPIKVEKSAFFPDQSTLSLRHSETEWDNALYMHDLIASLMPSCKILVKIGPVVSAENSLTDGNCAATLLQFDNRRPFISNY